MWEHTLFSMTDYAKLCDITDVLLTLHIFVTFKMHTPQ